MDEWVPVLSGGQLERAGEVIDGILQDFRRQLDRFEEGPAAATLAWGLPAAALVFRYGAAGADDLQLADSLVNRAISVASSAVTRHDLFGGTTGVAWTALHIAGTRAAPLFDAFDEWLLEVLEYPPSDLDHDLVRGVTGIGVYWLELDRTQSEAALLRIVDRYYETASIGDAGAAWHTPAWRQDPHFADVFAGGAYHVGIAHGAAGVVALLSRLYERNIDRERTGKLLSAAARWVLSQKTGGDASQSLFQAMVAEGESRAARPGWCYGDLGIAAALLRAGGIGEAEWEREALSAARRAALDPLQFAQETFLCHGLAGIGHLFSRFFNATGDEIFRDAARCAFEVLLDRYVEPDETRPSAAVLKALPFDGTLGLLYGRAGIALALLGAAKAAEPLWDRALLIDL